jgi:CBS domain-containing protein
MRTLPKPLFLLTAGDLLTDAVVVIPQDMSLQGAARRLIESQVSGAPVVDDEGRCVGVISAGDFVLWAGKEKNPRAQPTNPGCVCASWQIVEADEMSDECRVRHLMTTDPVTVILSTPVQKLAQMMLDAHIHRLIVVDRQHHPVGIISSTDILAALARAENESHRMVENVPADVRF